MPAAIDKKYTGGPSNSDPTLSLGGASSSVSVPGAPLNNLYEDVTPADAGTGVTHYRAIDLLNTGDEAAVAVECYMDPITSSGDTELQFGIEADPINSVLPIADEDTAPAGVSFAHYPVGSKLPLPDIPNGSYARLWLARVVDPGAVNTALDQGTINTDFA